MVCGAQAQAPPHLLLLSSQTTAFFPLLRNNAGRIPSIVLPCPPAPHDNKDVDWNLRKTTIETLYIDLSETAQLMKKHACMPLRYLVRDKPTPS